MFSKWLDWALRRVFGTPVHGTGQKLTVSASSAISTALTPGTMVRLASTVNCWVGFSSSGSATALDDGTDELLIGSCPEIYTVDDTRIYVVCLLHSSEGSDGELSIMPLAGYRVP